MAPEDIVTEPAGMYVPRVARWNHTKICAEFLKDIDLSEYQVNLSYIFCHNKNIY